MSMCDLTLEEAKALELVTLFCDYVRQRGKFGRATTWNYKKTSVIRAERKTFAIEPSLPTPKARAAFAWLLAYNATYKFYFAKQQAHLEASQGNPSLKHHLQTAEIRAEWRRRAGG